MHNGLQSVDFHKEKYIVPLHITILLVPFSFRHTVNTKCDQTLIMHFILRLREHDRDCWSLQMVHTVQQIPKWQICKSPLVTAYCQRIFGHQNLHTFSTLNFFPQYYLKNNAHTIPTLSNNSNGTVESAYVLYLQILAIVFQQTEILHPSSL